MTGLPITSSLPTQALPQRDLSLVMISRPAGAVPAVIGTITEQAVQQSRPLDMGPIDTRSRVTSLLERPRLAGPPPAFELNLLQQLRETRVEPADTSAAKKPEQATQKHRVDAETQAAGSWSPYDPLGNEGSEGAPVLIDKFL